MLYALDPESRDTRDPDKPPSKNLWKWDGRDDKDWFLLDPDFKQKKDKPARMETIQGKNAPIVTQVKYADDCHQNATCMNVHGVFYCSCDSGFTGNGKNCSDIDECDSRSQR